MIPFPVGRSVVAVLIAVILTPADFISAATRILTTRVPGMSLAAAAPMTGRI